MQVKCIKSMEWFKEWEIYECEKVWRCSKFWELRDLSWLHTKVKEWFIPKYTDIREYPDNFDVVI